jgi:hypothetical protein
VGVAAYNRGNAVISRQTEEAFSAIRKREDLARMVEIEMACDEWRRAAMSWLVDARHGDVRTFAAQATRELADRGDRVFASRIAKVGEAHRAWLDVDSRDQLERTIASRRWAQALWRLLDWARINFACPVVDDAPRWVRA